MSRWDPADDEVRDPRPYDFAGAKAAHARGSRDQGAASQWVAAAAEQYAEAERAYRVKLAQTITRLISDGKAATVAGDLARGVPEVAELKMKRDIAKGIMDAAENGAWQASANRRALEQLVTWSMKVSPDGQYEERQ